MKKAIFLFDYTGIMAKPWADAGYLCFCFDGQHPQGVTKSNHPNILNVGMWFDKTPSRYSDVLNVLAVTGRDVDFIFGFPECTDLAVSGAAHFNKKRRENPRFQEEVMQLVYLTEGVAGELDCPWGLENPVSVISSMWRKPDFIFHPYEYGGHLPVGDVHPTFPQYIRPRDAYPKKTCIWSGGGFVKPAMKKVGPDCTDLIDGLYPVANPLVTRTRQGIDKFGRKIVIDSVEPENKNYTVDGVPVWGYSDQHKKLGGKSLKTKNIRSATPRGFAQAVFEANGHKE